MVPAQIQCALPLHLCRIPFKSLKLFTMKELLSKMTWEVTEKPLELKGIQTGNHKVLYRSDNKRLLSVRSGKYKTLKNSELHKLADRICERGNFQLAGFAEFQGGRKILCYLKNMDTNLRLNKLAVEEFLLLGNSHDGSSKIFVGTANQILRCSNQFSLKLRSFEIGHTRALDFLDEELDRFIQCYQSGREKLYQQMEALSNKTVSDQQIEELLGKILKESSNDVQTTKDSSRKQLLQSSIATETSELGKNGWGLLNGVTHFTSHHLKNANLLPGNVAGRASEINKHAFEYCMQLN